MRSFNAISDERAAAAVDVYVQADGSEKFWFVGKSCARRGACDDEAALSVVVQKRLVLEHAKLLQGELKRAKGKLLAWCAPANTEVAVAQRQQGLRSLVDIKARDLLSMEDCGFMPEQVCGLSVATAATISTACSYRCCCPRG